MQKQGFSLIELSISMAIIAILASSILPIGIRSFQIKAAEKTGLEMVMIQDASRNYYMNHNEWPANISVLKEQGYLNPNWTALNPWKNAYQMTVASLGLTVFTDVPVEWTQLVASRLSVAVINNTQVSSTVASLGAAGISSGIIVAWSGSIASIPEDWVLCDGENGTPDLRDKFIVGASQDVTGIAKTNILGSLLQTGGVTTHNHSGLTGAHRLTIAEMPSHNHTMDTWIGGLNGGGGPVWGHDSSNGYGGKQSVDSNGGNQSHTHTISSENQVPPFYALAFIMKI